MSTDYKELIDDLRLGTKSRACMFEAADTIEKLIFDRGIYIELWVSCKEELKQAQSKLDKINSLKHDGYYTGTYVKSLIENEERKSDWKDESVTFFPANKEVE